MHTVIPGKPTVVDLGDIDIEAVVELGRTPMPVRQARALASGDVIRLPQLCGEPARVLMNGHAFAEGEIVCATDILCVRLTRLDPPPEARGRGDGGEGS